MYNDLTFISNKMRLEKELAGAVRFERTERGLARSLDYKSSALGPSAMLPIIDRRPCRASLGWSPIFVLLEILNTKNTVVIVEAL